MVIITHFRKKCIGCNYCVEIAQDHWRMSKKDGKSVLLGAQEKKGIYTLRTNEEALEANLAAAKACPVNVIQVKHL
jgi:ferredoxin